MLYGLGFGWAVCLFVSFFSWVDVVIVIFLSVHRIFRYGRRLEAGSSVELAKNVFGILLGDKLVKMLKGEWEEIKVLSYGF